MISKSDYKELKPMFDFQRLKEYNKEICRYAVESVMAAGAEIIEDETGEEAIQELIDNWMQPENEKEWKKPPVEWVPAEKNFRIESEDFDYWISIKKDVMKKESDLWLKENNQTS